MLQVTKLLISHQTLLLIFKCKFTDISINLGQFRKSPKRGNPWWGLVCKGSPRWMVPLRRRLVCKELGDHGHSCSCTFCKKSEARRTMSTNRHKFHDFWPKISPLLAMSAIKSLASSVQRHYTKVIISLKETFDRTSI